MGNEVQEMIVFILEKTGKTKAEIAAKLKVSSTAVQNWESGGGASSGNHKKIEKLYMNVLGKEEKAAADYSSEGNLPFGHWLRGARQSAGMTVSELANAAGVSKPAIYGIENGRINNPQRATRERLEKALHVEAPQRIVDEAQRQQQVKGLGSLVDFEPYNKADWPICRGVYVLYDVSQRPIYVGKGKISTRLAAHQDKFWFKRPIVEYGSYIEVEDDALCDQLEQVLIKFLKSNKVINRQLTEAFE